MVLALNPRPITVSFCLFHIGDLQRPGIAGQSGHSEFYRVSDERDEHGRFPFLEHTREELPDAAVDWPDSAPTHESRMII